MGLRRVPNQSQKKLKRIRNMSVRVKQRCLQLSELMRKVGNISYIHELEGIYP